MTVLKCDYYFLNFIYVFVSTQGLKAKEDHLSLVLFSVILTM